MKIKQWRVKCYIVKDENGKPSNEEFDYIVNMDYSVTEPEVRALMLERYKKNKSFILDISECDGGL